MLKLYLKRALADPFIKNNIIFFIGSLSVAVLNYIFYPILARIMSIEAFGEFQALISLLLISSVILNVIKVIVVNIAANHEDKQEKIEIISSLLKLSFYVMLAISIFLMVFSSQIRHFLNFTSFFPFVSVAVLLIIELYFTFRTAIMQGKHEFVPLSISGLINALARIIFSCALVLLGLASLGAITGLIFAQIAAYFYVYKKTASYPLSIRKKIIYNKQISKELVYGMIILFTTLCITFLYTFDVILVKHYFPPEEAGLYSGIATIARIVFFITGSVAGVLLPTIKINHPKSENHRILLKAILIVLAIGGSILAFFCVFPDFTIKLLIGSRYLSAASLLPWLGILCFLVSIINLLFFYYLALRKHFLVYISIISPILVTILCYFFHETLMQIIYNFIIGAVLVLVFLFARISFIYFKESPPLGRGLRGG